MKSCYMNFLPLIFRVEYKFIQFSFSTPGPAYIPQINTPGSNCIIKHTLFTPNCKTNYFLITVKFVCYEKTYIPLYQ